MKTKGKLATELQARVLDHPEIEIRKSRFADKEAFFVGKKEIGHFHSGNEVDIRVTKKQMKALGLSAESDARITIRSKASEWLEFTFRKEADLVRAVELFEVAAKANR